MTGERLTYTVEEAGQLLGISRGLAYSAAASGDLPTIRLGRRLIVPKARLLELLGDEQGLPKGRSPADTGLQTNGAQAPERVVHDKPT